jgi:hypothetical protein
MDTQPVPLQLFMPLQLFFADLHSDVPLQELTPVQWTVALSAATDTVANPELNNIAAVAASAALDTLVICMIESSIVIERSDIAAPLQRPGEREDYYSIVSAYASFDWLRPDCIQIGEGFEQQRTICSP